MRPLAPDPEEVFNPERVTIGSNSVASGVTNSGQPTSSGNTAYSTSATLSVAQLVSIPITLVHLASHHHSPCPPIGPLSKNLGRTAVCQDEKNCSIKNSLSAKVTETEVFPGV